MRVGSTELVTLGSLPVAQAVELRWRRNPPSDALATLQGGWRGTIRRMPNVRRRHVGLWGLVALCCAHAGQGYPPPCAPGVDRNDCYRAPATANIPTGPRCARLGGSCGPIPYSVKHGSHSPNSDRYPFSALNGILDCRTDADCELRGCGNACTNWRAENGPAICPGFPALYHALCGCVRGECAWFEE